MVSENLRKEETAKIRNVRLLLQRGDATRATALAAAHELLDWAQANSPLEDEAYLINLAAALKRFFKKKYNDQATAEISDRELQLRERILHNDLDESTLQARFELAHILYYLKEDPKRLEKSTELLSKNISIFDNVNSSKRPLALECRAWLVRVLLKMDTNEKYYEGVTVARQTVALWEEIIQHAQTTHKIGDKMLVNAILARYDLGRGLQKIATLDSLREAVTTHSLNIGRWDLVKDPDVEIIQQTKDALEASEAGLATLLEAHGRQEVEQTSVSMKEVRSTAVLNEEMVPQVTVLQEEVSNRKEENKEQVSDIVTGVAAQEKTPLEVPLEPKGEGARKEREKSHLQQYDPQADLLNVLVGLENGKVRNEGRKARPRARSNVSLTPRDKSQRARSAVGGAEKASVNSFSDTKSHEKPNLALEGGSQRPRPVANGINSGELAKVESLHKPHIPISSKTKSDELTLVDKTSLTDLSALKPLDVNCTSFDQGFPKSGATKELVVGATPISARPTSAHEMRVDGLQNSAIIKHGLCKEEGDLPGQQEEQRMRSDELTRPSSPINEVPRLPKGTTLAVSATDKAGTADEWFKRVGEMNRILRKRKDAPDRKGTPAYSRVKIAILDTGIRRDSPYWPKIKMFKDFVSKGNTEGGDETNHGTNGVHLIFKCISDADVYVARVFKKEESDYNTVPLMTEAIKWATGLNVDIISMSFGFEQSDREMTRALEDAKRENILLFAAASNYENLGGVTYPATLWKERTVMCIFSASGGGMASHFNPSVSALSTWTTQNFAFLGEEVDVGRQNSDVVRGSGTSLATSIAAGIAGRMIDFSRHDEFGFDPVETKLCCEQLKTISGMAAIFEDMAKKAHNSGFQCVQPWTITDPLASLKGAWRLKMTYWRMYLTLRSLNN